MNFKSKYKCVLKFRVNGMTCRCYFESMPDLNAYVSKHRNIWVIDFYYT